MRREQISIGVLARLLTSFLSRNRAAQVVLVLGAAITLAASLYVAETTRKDNSDYFERQVAEAQSTVNQHLKMNLEVLRGLQALFLQAGERPVSREEFQRYASHLNLEGRYPGIRALSFNRYLHAEQLASYEDSIRRDPNLSRPNFVLRPDSTHADHFIVDFISPGNKGDDYMLGIDLGSEPNRRDTLERARDSGLPAASRRITLTMREDGPPGFFVAAPVYRSGQPLGSVEERRRAFLGCVTAVFGSDELFSHLFGAPLLKEVDIEIYDAPLGIGNDHYSTDNVLFDSAVEIVGHSMPLHAPTTTEDFRQIKQLDIADRQWSTVYTAMPSLGASSGQNILPALVACIGITLSLLLVALIGSYSRANRQLASEVAERTAALVATQAEGADSAEKLSTANHDLELTRSQLLQAEKMSSLGQLAAGVAHEINNPIGFVKSNLGSLTGQVEDLLHVLDAYAEADAMLIATPEIYSRIRAAKSQADIEFVRQDIRNLIAESIDGVQRVKKIVEDLKDFSRTDRGEWHRANIEAGIESTLNIVWNEIKYKAEVVKEYGGIPEIECIGSQLDQVFMNLLVNAAHAIEGRGTITIRTRVDTSNVLVEIEDTGQGISPENLKRIFDPFFTTKPVGQGTGLGLSVVHGIVERHGGSIDVKSELGQGTRFRLSLPLNRQEAEAASEPGTLANFAITGEEMKPTTT